MSEKRLKRELVFVPDGSPKLPSGFMMEKLRDKLGGQAALQGAVQAWRAAHPIPDSGGQWPPFMDAVEALYRQHFEPRVPTRGSRIIPQ